MGRVLAVDPGTVRVGLAVSDSLRITAQPLEVVAAGEAVARVAQLVEDLEIDQVVVGLPVTESGEEGHSAAAARLLAAAIADRTGIAVSTLDERYTSRMAENTMIDAGARRRQRREAVDKVAAAVILRSYLDRPRSES